MTFHLVLVGWFLFRIDTTEQASQFLGNLLSATGGTQLSVVFYLIVSLGVLTQVIPRSHIHEVVIPAVTRRPAFATLAYAALLLLFLGLSVETPQFIYFQF